MQVIVTVIPMVQEGKSILRTQRSGNVRKKGHTIIQMSTGDEISVRNVNLPRQRMAFQLEEIANLYVWISLEC